MYKYTIEEQTENPDPGKALIKKTGSQPVEVVFTLEQVRNQLKDFKNKVKQFEAQIKIHEAEMKNVEGIHPQVIDLDEKLLQAAYVYVEAKINKEAESEKLKAYQQAITETEEELEEIIKQTKLPTPSDVLE